jgi:large subunit ribosomal protein L10
MPRTDKVEKVAELKSRIQGSQAMFLTDFRGLTVGDVTDLRRSLRESGTKLAVVKNTLMRRAADEAGADELQSLLDGPTAVAFVDGDPIVAAKSLVDAMRRFRTMSFKGGFMEGRILSPEQAQSLATIEPREVLLSQMAGLAKAQMSRAAYGFQALQARFLALLEALQEKMPREGDGERPVPEEQEEQPTAEPPEEAPEESNPSPEAGGEDQ